MLLFCQFDMCYHMELSSVKKFKMVNKTYVKCNMFKRGNNLFSVNRENRDLYICICKNIFKYILIFYVGNISQIRHKDTWKSFF